MNEFLENKIEPIKLELIDGTVGTHTARINKTLYDIFRLRNFSENIPIETISVASLVKNLQEGNHFWTDTEGNSFGPFEILQDWEFSKQNPLWRKHIQQIEKADLSFPIWIYGDKDHVFDGMHRIMKAILDDVPEIRCQRWQVLPQEAIINKTDE